MSFCLKKKSQYIDFNSYARKNGLVIYILPIKLKEK